MLTNGGREWGSQMIPLCEHDTDDADDDGAMFSTKDPTLHLAFTCQEHE